VGNSGYDKVSNTGHLFLVGYHNPGDYSGKGIYPNRENYKFIHISDEKTSRKVATSKTKKMGEHQNTTQRNTSAMTGGRQN
jgi:hypothetical protein